MANLFDDLEVDESQEIEEQSVRKEVSWIKDTGAYPMTVAMFRFGESTGGASFFEVTLETSGGAKISEKEYFSSKAGKTTYPVKDRATGVLTGEHKDLPGMAKLKGISRALTGDPMAWKTTAALKVIPIYDFDKKADIDTECGVFVGALGKEVEVLVQRTLYDKDKKNAEGNYVPSTEVMAKSEIVAWLDPTTHKTFSETEGGLDAKSYDTFNTNMAENPVKDKRKVSKNTDANAKPAPAAPSEDAVNAFK